LFGAYGGVLADRFSKRNLLFVTQSLMTIPALGLFLVTLLGIEQPWMIDLGVFLFGAVNCVDNPTRQSFVIEMVGEDRLVNAVSLNSVIIETARIIGPAIAGVIIATAGVVPCFAINLLTFIAMIVALWSMDPRALQAPPPAVRKPGAIREGLRHVRRSPELAIPLALMALVGTLGFNFQVALPLLAKFSFGGGAGSYAVLVCAMGAGSIVAALVNGNQGKTGSKLIAAASLAFGVTALVAAVMPDLILEAVTLAALGAAAVIFVSSVNSTIQLAVSAEMRGRVMALFSIVFLGSTPIGGPLTGWLAENYDPRWTLVLAGISGLSAAWAARLIFSRMSERAGVQSRPLEATV
ncbi:MAG TPA: MFS transporter, partial [Solirubrobacterales bacterium]|nr:MFS transporter [Solirubrobacterales bacterium]